MKKRLVGLLLLLFVASVYYRAPVHFLSDSYFSLLMDEAILEHGSPNLMPYQVPRGQGVPFVNHGYLWTLDLVNGRLLYVFPWGGALLALPSVAVFEAAGLKVAPQGVYNPNNELKMQVYLTTISCALIVWLLFDTAAQTMPLGWSFTMAIGAALGTQIWSTASRSLWPQTWNLLLVSVAIWLLVRGRTRPILLGTALAWACFARPQSIPTAAMIGVYVLIEHGWQRFLECAVTVAVWAAVFAWVMLSSFGQLMPLGYQGGLDFPHEFLHRLEGVLISPSRGLFVFVPIALLPVYLTVRYWQVLPHRRLAILAIAAITLQVIMTASWVCWWGGGSYGPRLLLETIPWFFLLATLSIKPFLEDRQLTMQECAAVISAAILLLILSVAMNSVGALSSSAVDWNGSVADCSIPNPQQLWEWQHPQFLAWAQR